MENLLFQILETDTERKGSLENPQCLSLFRNGGYADFCKTWPWVAV